MALERARKALRGLLKLPATQAPLTPTDSRRLIPGQPEPLQIVGISYGRDNVGIMLAGMVSDQRLTIIGARDKLVPLFRTWAESGQPLVAVDGASTGLRFLLS